MGGKGKKKTRFKRLNGARSNRHVSYSPAFGSEVRLTCILSQISRDTKTDAMRDWVSWKIRGF
jgi:hypothetical protein